MFLLEDDKVWCFICGGRSSKAADVVVPYPSGVRNLGRDIIAEEGVLFGMCKGFCGAFALSAGGVWWWVVGGVENGVVWLVKGL